MDLGYSQSARQNRTDVADRLRDQAAACRRLSSVARTATGAAALLGIAGQYDADACQLDVASTRSCS